MNSLINILRGLWEEVGIEHQIVGESASFLREIEKISVIAKSNSTVLIAGETGTGKELCARAIHQLSLRSGSHFVPVNCGAIPQRAVRSPERGLYGRP